MTPARIVQKRPRKALPPRLQNRLQCPAIEMRAQHVLEQVNHPHAGDSGTDCEVDCSAGSDEKRSRRIQLHHLAVTLEIPGRRSAAGKLATQARMSQQVARMLGSAMRVEIAWRRGGSEALHTRTEW